MKKLLIAAITTVLCSSAAYAQPAKGTWMIGAGIANASGYYSPGVGKQFNANFHPMAGYFLTNKILVGSGITLGYGKFFRSYSIGYGISPFARYYFAPKGGIQLNKLTPFAEVSAQYGGGRFVDRVNNTAMSGSALSAGYGLGLSYAVAKNVSIEGLFKMNHNVRDNSTVPKPNFSMTPSLGIGFQIYLGRGKKAEKLVE